MSVTSGNGGRLDLHNGRLRRRPDDTSAEQQGRTGGGAGEPALAEEVFRLFPYGIMVLDAAGSAVAANAEAEELLGGTLGTTACCCNLFGCGRRGTPLEAACLTELVRERAARLPEVRLDLMRPGGSGAVWVTAAPLGGTRNRIVVQLRAADSRDRRRRTAPHWTRGAQLRIVALGRTRVESREGPIGGAWLEQRPGQLLKYMVCNRGRVVTVEELANAFWPDAGKRALGSVRHYVHELRDRLEPERTKRVPSSFVLARQGGYTFDRNRVSFDLDEFEEQARRGLAEQASGNHDPARALLEAALDLYGGDLFAEDPYEVWTLDERDRLRELAARGLRALADIAAAAGELDDAHEQIARLAALEPYDMETQRELIRSFVRRGRRSEATRRFNALRARMLHEFGEEPDFDLADLAAKPAARLHG